ncbi:MAG TPA: hypothetical protein VF637_15450 [Sphingomicrobium sp.]
MEQERNSGGNNAEAADDTVRPQQGGEAGTTRFGMEDGDNTNVPAAGISPDQQARQQK